MEGGEVSQKERERSYIPEPGAGVGEMGQRLRPIREVSSLGLAAVSEQASEPPPMGECPKIN